MDKMIVIFYLLRLLAALFVSSNLAFRQLEQRAYLVSAIVCSVVDDKVNFEYIKDDILNDGYFAYDFYGIEKIYVLDREDYNKIKRENNNYSLQHYRNSFFDLRSGGIGSAFKKELNDFIRSKMLDKQIVGIDKSGSSVVLYVVDKNSNFLEKKINKSFKKTVIAKRAGIDLSIELRAKIVSFSKLGLGKSKLDGVIGLLTSQGRLKLEKDLNTSSVSIAQVTLACKDGCRLLLGAKGTIGIAVSPIQKEIVEKYDRGDFDMILNRDEIDSYSGHDLPCHDSELVLKPGDLSIKNVLDNLPRVVSKIDLFHVLNFINDPILTNAIKRVWLEKINASANHYNFSRDEKKFKADFVALSYFISLPAYVRFLWADESLDISACLVPESLKESFPIGSNVLIVSHPIYFDLNYAILSIAGYTKSESFVLNPDLCRRILRDQDGDTLSIVPPSELHLVKGYVPKDYVITTKKPLPEEDRSNECMMDFAFDRSCGVVFFVNNILNIYLHMLENNRHDLISKNNVKLARFYQAVLDSLKKIVDSEYTAHNFVIFIKSLYADIYGKPLASEGASRIIPSNNVYKTLKDLKNRVKFVKNQSELEDQFEQVKNIIFSVDTKIEFLKDLWCELKEKAQILEDQIYIFAVSWPYSYCCYGKAKRLNPLIDLNDFSIHGLWPKKCDSKVKFEFNEELLTSETLMLCRQFWPSLDGHSNFDFWSHEWMRHGCCASHTQQEYFKKVIDFYKSNVHRKIINKLKQSGIFPSNYRKYKYRDIYELFNTDKQYVRISTKNINGQKLLTGLKFCLTRNFEEAVECPRENLGKELDSYIVFPGPTREANNSN